MSDKYYQALLSDTTRTEQTDKLMMYLVKVDRFDKHFEEIDGCFIL